MSRRRRHLVPRRGVTMVELMVALMIVSVGLLALASSATLVTRLMGGGATQTRAAALAYTNLEKLRSVSCANAVAGADTVRGIVSTWTVQSIVASSTTRGLSVNLTVKYPTSKGPRTQTYKTIVPC
jgi:prepilin-type N-terminal cleavage/methylation domain-containing protein